MKLATFTALAMLLSAGYAFAGAGAPAPTAPPGGTSSGAPSAVLNDKECEDAWNKAVAGPAGGAADRVLTPDKGAKIMTNFQQADTDKDGTVDKAEFQAACKNGLVQRSTEQPSKP
jgi:EF hand